MAKTSAIIARNALEKQPFAFRDENWRYMSYDSYPIDEGRSLSACHAVFHQFRVPSGWFGIIGVLLWSTRTALLRCGLRFERLDARQLMAVDVLESKPTTPRRRAPSFPCLPTRVFGCLGRQRAKDDKDYSCLHGRANMRVSVSVASTAGAKLEVNTRAGAQVFENEPKDGLKCWGLAGDGRRNLPVAIASPQPNRGSVRSLLVHRRWLDWWRL